MIVRKVHKTFQYANVIAFSFICVCLHTTIVAALKKLFRYEDLENKFEHPSIDNPFIYIVGCTQLLLRIGFVLKKSYLHCDKKDVL